MAEAPVTVLIIPKETYLRCWHRTCTFDELARALRTESPDEENSTACSATERY